jgi:hypothetical protein
MKRCSLTYASSRKQLKQKESKEKKASKQNGSQSQKTIRLSV